ncbi:carbohydrate ABC transporter permease [Azospirillum sp. A39]|uniref:carbohydrate ABC transporter permease n=1 Tax=Azospirillum sp. A39 TaxID=3462279 RepID=UPI004045971B
MSALARQRRRAAALFLAPMLTVLALVAAWPLARTVAFSFTDATLGSLDAYGFVGIENYVWLAGDPDWWRAVWNTVVFAAVSVALETVLGLVIALTLNARMPGRGLLRAAVLIPWAIPTVVSAQMWGWMFHDLYGVVNEGLLALGLIAAPRAWTADPDLALPTVILVDVWKSTPFMTLLILAALQLLPQDLYEAARVDGVHPVRVFFRVTLPLIRPALTVAVIFRTLDALRVFDLMYVLTGNSRETMSMSVYARQQLIDFQDIGYGSATATFLVGVVALVTVAMLTVGRVRLGTGEGPS